MQSTEPQGIPDDLMTLRIFPVLHKVASSTLGVIQKNRNLFFHSVFFFTKINPKTSFLRNKIILSVVEEDFKEKKCPKQNYRASHPPVSAMTFKCHHHHHSINEEPRKRHIIKSKKLSEKGRSGKRNPNVSSTAYTA